MKEDTEDSGLSTQGLTLALVVKWTSREFAELELQVRFLAGAFSEG